MLASSSLGLRIGSLVLLTGLLSACQARGGPIPSIFQISSAQEGAAISAAHRTGTGKLTVTISGLLDRLRGFTVLATMADVEAVEITVKAADGQVFTQRIGKAAIAEGRVTATFTSLPLGPALVTMKAFDQTGAVIGSSTAGAKVVEGPPVEVSIHLTLAPTFTGPGGSGGAGDAPTGGLSVGGTLADGPVVTGTPAPPGTIIGSYTIMPAWEGYFDLAVDASNHLWVATGSRLLKVGAGGAVLGSYLASDGPTHVAPAPNGHLWVLGWPTESELPILIKLAQDGTVAGRYQVFGPNEGHVDLEVDSSGKAWILVSSQAPTSKLYRVDVDGTVAAVYDMPESLEILKIDPFGEFWATGVHSNGVVKIASDGTIASRSNFMALGGHALGGRALTVDHTGHAWASNDMNEVFRFAPDGTPAGQFSMGPSDSGMIRAMAVDKGGQLYLGYELDLIVKAGPTGAVLTSYPGASGMNLTFDLAGYLWSGFMAGGPLQHLAP